MKPCSDKKINFYLRIISAIRSTGKLPLDLKPQNARYYTKPLVDSKLIEYRGSGATGLWVLTDYFTKLEGKGLIKKTNLDALVKPAKSVRVKNIRGHGFVMRLRLGQIGNWHNRFQVMKTHGYKPLKLKTGATKIMLDGNKTHLCDRSIVMYFDSDYSFVGKTAVDSLSNATKYFLRQISKLESHFKISFKINGKYKYKCSKHHFGDLGNIVAKKCHSEGKSYTIYREDGKPWLEIDFSNNVVETETVSSDTAVFDMDAKIKPFFDELDRNPHFPREIRREITDLKKENTELKDFIKSNAYMMQELMQLHKSNTEDIKLIKDKL